MFDIEKAGTPAQFEVPVEVDGVSLKLDARRVRSMDMLRNLAKVQETGNNINALLGLYDYMLGDEKASLEAQLTELHGYVDYEAYIAICQKAFDAAVPKN